MTDSQLFVLSFAIIFPVSVLIFQVGQVASAIRDLKEAIRQLRFSKLP